MKRREISAISAVEGILGGGRRVGFNWRIRSKCHDSILEGHFSFDLREVARWQGESTRL